MITVYGMASCGCCVVKMKFKDESSVQNAFTNDELTGTGNITDDDGIIHDLDTFYGFSLNEEELYNRAFGFLNKVKDE